MREILSREIYSIKSPGHILIGDPMYLEHIEAGTANNGMKSLVIDLNIPKVRLCSLTIEHVREDGEEFPQYGPYDSYVVKFSFSNSKQALDAYERGRYYPSHVNYQKELGCDTACFEMYVGERCEHFDTMADGTYGYATIHKGTFGGTIDLFFDADVFDLTELKQSLFYLFDIPKKEFEMNTEAMQIEEASVEKENLE